MTKQDYITQTLTRTDVVDLVRFEPVELDPQRNPITWTTSKGSTYTKYDVHLILTDGTIQKWTKEHIAIMDEGKTNENVVYLAQSTAPAVVTPSQVQTYIKGLGYAYTEIVKEDDTVPYALFRAFKDNGDGTGTILMCYAYMKAGKPTTIVLNETPVI